jgi:uncharacterized membrane protein
VITRRQFSKLSLTGAILGSAFFLVGCPLGTIEADIAAYAPVAIQAFTAILGLFDPPLAALVLADSNLVLAGLTGVEKAIADWKVADATQKPGLVGGIEAALQVTIADFQTFLTSVDANAPKSLVSTVNALALIILGVLQSFANRLGAAPATAMRTMAIHEKVLQVEPLKLSVKQFRAAFNAKCVALGVPKAQIKN